MNAQDIFDTVVKHLFAQGKQALDHDGDCVYRSPTGLKCAVGCLIPDDKYDPELESRTIRTLLNRGVLPLEYSPHRMLLGALQGVHDDPDNWESRTLLKEHLVDVAIQHNLKVDVMDAPECHGAW